jgi:GNAT superfamily N-acetyltransferase
MTSGESVERDAQRDLHRALPEPAARTWGIGVLELAGAVCTCLGSDPSLAPFNRVIGLGLEEPVTPRVLDAIESFYASSGAGFLVQGTVAGLEERGYTREPGAAVLERSAVAPLPVATASLAVSEPSSAEEFGVVCAEASGLPELFAVWFATLVCREHWHCFLAREAEGGAAVATGALYAGDGVGYLGFAATLPDRRGQGAQTALVSSRLARAHALGLATVVATTAEPVDGQTGASYRNLERLGFRQTAVRPGWRSPA